MPSIVQYIKHHPPIWPQAVNHSSIPGTVPGSLGTNWTNFISGVACIMGIFVLSVTRYQALIVSVPENPFNSEDGRGKT